MVILNAKSIPNISPLVLGIEASILSGSLSLYDGESQIHSSTAGVSRSESLMPAVSDLFRNSAHSIHELTDVAVSVGPGSFTGIRIGIATALGITSALGIRCTGISTLDAVLPEELDDDGVVIVPLGRDQYGIRGFDRREVSPTSALVEILDGRELLSRVISVPSLRYYLPYECSEDLGVGFLLKNKNVFFGDEPTSANLCRLSANGKGSSDLTPIYLRREH